MQIVRLLKEHSLDLDEESRYIRDSTKRGAVPHVKKEHQKHKRPHHFGGLEAVL